MMRRSRDELAAEIDDMVRLRTEENKTYRQIAAIKGYKSPGTVSDLLRTRGHFSLILNQLEINLLMTILKSKPESRLISGVLGKLTKASGK